MAFERSRRDVLGNMWPTGVEFDQYRDVASTTGEWPAVGRMAAGRCVRASRGSLSWYSPTVDELKQQLARLSRTDALLCCARLNLVVSNGTYHDDLEKQRFAVQAIFLPE